MCVKMIDPLRNLNLMQVFVGNVVSVIFNLVVCLKWVNCTVGKRSDDDFEIKREEEQDEPPYFGIIDCAVLAAVLVGSCWWWRSSSSEYNSNVQTADNQTAKDDGEWMKYIKDAKTDEDVPERSSVDSSGDKAKLKGFVKKMISSRKRMVVFYGSQTGTAEEFACRIVSEGIGMGVKGVVADPESSDMSDLTLLKSLVEYDQGFKERCESVLAVFVMATYGEGDPTDNAQEFHDWLRDDAHEGCLSGLDYTVFGLGNKTYENFNTMGKYVDKRMEELGGNRIFELGLGDDDSNLEEDFLVWKDAFWRSISVKFNLKNDLRQSTDVQFMDLTKVNEMRNFQIVEIQDPRGSQEDSVDGIDKNRLKVFSGEPARLNSYKNQRPLFDAKNPYLAKVTVNRNLHSPTSDRVCMHIELDIKESKMRYNSGDHVAVFAQNDVDLVTRLAHRLNIFNHLDTVFEMTAVDEDSERKTPFPCPTTYRTAFTHYVDISSRPRTHVLKALSVFCDEEVDQRKLRTMSSISEEGKALNLEWIVNGCRNIVHILEDLPSCHPPPDLIMEILPRLQPRFYSISSSSKVHPQSVHITAVLVEYETPSNRTNKGVATSLLHLKQPSQQIVKTADSNLVVPIYIRRSSFRLPIKSSVPVIMIGPGTGVAPFRGFIQERQWLRDHQSKEVGETVLFFGCRNKEKDFLYREELEEYVKSGCLTLHTAFSRDTPDHKIYVTDLLLSESVRSNLWHLINDKHGHIYVCGDAKMMAKGVHNAICNVVARGGEMSEEDALSYVKQMEHDKRYSADVWS